MKTVKFYLARPVSILKGNEFLPIQRKTFAQQILEFFLLTTTLQVVKTNDGNDGCFQFEGKSSVSSRDVLNRKNPEIAASSLVRDSSTASPQSQGSIAKGLANFLKAVNS